MFIEKYQRKSLIKNQFHKKQNTNMHSSIWHSHILILSLDKDQQRKYIFLLTHVNAVSRKLWKCNSFQNLLRMKYMTGKEHSEDETCACHMVFSPYYIIVGTFWAYMLIFPRYLILKNYSKYSLTNTIMNG